MNDSDNFFLIVIAFIAGFIILQLRRTLGRRDGYDGKDEKQSKNRFDESPLQKDNNSNDNVIPINGEAEDGLKDRYQESKDIGVAKSSPHYSVLEKIRAFDRGFTLPTFYDGAEYAYGMILNAFWTGDTKTLRNFLSRDVFSQFESAIEDMKDQGQEFYNVLKDVEQIELENASLDGSMAEITVKYKSHMTIAIKDEQGNVVEGDEEKIIPVVDIWTFCRDVKRNDPNWTLVSTTA